ncbi:SprT-like family-domain-containing protein [Podospora didyma]|uniref:SprT-like family-domain-containing protein n=1 Tax=Podospora didyma TaxID=330526 RepID=A0AAE0NPG8_9PEZI|nr:SprT-like family-domain-containing protein [Podospora didyma]
MARASKPVKDRSDDDLDDEFPDVATLALRMKQLKQKETTGPGNGEKTKTTMAAATVRRRKLGGLVDTPLLRAWTPDKEMVDAALKAKRESETRPPRVQLRARKLKPLVIASPDMDAKNDSFSGEEEIVEAEQVSEGEGTCASSESGDESSEFEVEKSENDSDDHDDSLADFFSRWRQPKREVQIKAKETQPPKSRVKDSGLPPVGRPRRNLLDKPSRDLQNKVPKGLVLEGSKKVIAERDLADTFSDLQINDEKPTEADKSRPRGKVTPPSTPPKPRRGLVSPTKLPRIPSTPHHPTSDLFWSRDFVDDWNDEHSPKKKLFPDAANRSPEKSQPSKKIDAAKMALDRNAKMAFQKDKQQVANNFLRELDTVLTNGEIGRLAESTGGVKIVWSKTLNTTAGRANWKQSRARTKQPDGSETTRIKQTAFIELAEKVIDDEHRLLNTVAHEFCHLAVYMIDKVLKHPHGPEFQQWAAKCSQTFADRGINVTTKHKYDIDFKYRWKCVNCSLEYKRHSKSIDPERQRCGACRSTLQQIKPVPRATTGKPNDYQVFMKQQMKLLKAQNPTSPQKDIMKMVASRWSQKGAAAPRPITPSEAMGVGKATDNLVGFDLTA